MNEQATAKDQPYVCLPVQGGMRYIDRIEGIECLIPDDVITISGTVRLEDQIVESDQADALIDRSINNPIGCPRLRNIGNGRETAAIMVSDATRAVDTARVLPHLVRELTEAGMTLEDIVVVVAVGVHRDATVDELRTIMGEYYNLLRIENHRPYDQDALVSLGVTSRGTMVDINRTVWQADIRIGIGKVEPHEFAGYSGGRKSVLPGIAGERTIRQNHRPEFISDQFARPCRLADNPVHLDMVEAARLLRVDFFVNLVQNSSGVPVAAFSGDIVASHNAAVAYLEERYGANVPSDANVFLTTPGPPLNIDMYQSVKSIFGLSPVLKQNDVIILYAACREGMNSIDMLAPFKHGSTCDEVMAYLNREYRIQMDQALLLCKILQQNVRLVVYSPGVPKEDLETMRMIPSASLSEAVELAAALKRADGEIPRMCVFPQAQRAVIRP